MAGGDGCCCSTVGARVEAEEWSVSTGGVEEESVDDVGSSSSSSRMREEQEEHEEQRRAHARSYSLRIPLPFFVSSLASLASS